MKMETPLSADDHLIYGPLVVSFTKWCMVGHLLQNTRHCGARVKAITDPNHEITYDPVLNPSLLDLMKKCLAREHKDRWRIPQLLSLCHHQLSPRVQHCKLLLQMSEVYKDVPEVSRLCLQLQQLLANPGPGVPSV